MYLIILLWHQTYWLVSLSVHLQTGQPKANDRKAVNQIRLSQERATEVWNGKLPSDNKVMSLHELISCMHCVYMGTSVAIICISMSSATPYTITGG